MSLVTFASDPIVDIAPSSAMGQEQPEWHSRPPYPNSRHPNGSLLWSFDESAERYESLLWSFDEGAESERFESIQRRLVQLEAALFDEFGTRINNASRKCLLRLFVASPLIRAPLISASPDGVLTATWRNALGEDLAIRCIGDSVIHFAITSRSLVQGHVFDRQWGTVHSASLFFAENPSAKRIAALA